MLRLIGFSLGLLMIVGCSGVTPRPSPLSSPFFLPTAEDTMRLATLTHELDTKAHQCGDTTACEEVKFGRALVSLFENQEAARASFQGVIRDNPSSPLATSSLLWLQLIGEEAVMSVSAEKRPSPLHAIAADFVRDWMERQLADRVNVSKPSSNTKESISEQSRALQVLQKQIRERDRRIAILRSQLEALKVIDHDHEERTRAPRIPATLLPMTETTR